MMQTGQSRVRVLQLLRCSGSGPSSCSSLQAAQGACWKLFEGLTCAPHLGFASSSQGPETDLSAIPFQVKREQAAEAFRAYHQGHWFSARPSSGLKKIKEAFLPFWVVSADVTVQLHSARIGFDQWVTRWDPRTRTARPELVTNWQRVTFQRAFWDQRYTPHDPGMQIYASYKYPRSEINVLRPGAAVQIARRFEPSMVASSKEGTRRVGPFQMKPALALRLANEWMKDQEESRARNFVKSSYRCNRVDSVEMDVRLSNVRASPLLFPVFIFSSRHFGDKVRTFVSGVSVSHVSGTRPLDETRIGLAAATVSGIALAFTGALATMSPFTAWSFGVALPGLAAGFAARYYTHTWRQWNSFWQTREQTSQEAENLSSSWDPEWVRDFARLEEQNRQREERQNFEQSYSSSFPGTGSSDPRGYYSTLGVSSTATKQEIQAAYRGLVLRYHPDRVPEKEKSLALRKFQVIQEAYSVLRDPKKRKQYDTGQSV